MNNDILCIYTVFQEKSISKAAKKLFITQPALSAIIKKTETALGSPIFDRSTMPLTVTEAGKYYINSIKKILLIEDDINRYFQDLEHRQIGNLKLGGSSFFCTNVFPPLVSKFTAKFPSIQIHTQEASAFELINALDNGKLDIVFETFISEKDSRFNVYFYENEYIILAVPLNWKINEKLREYRLTKEDIASRNFLLSTYKGVPFALFKDLPFIQMKEGNDQWRRGLDICKDYGFTPKTAYQMDQILTAFIVAATTSAGAIFVRDTLVRNFPFSVNSLVYYKIDHPLIKRKIVVATKKGRYLSDAMREFITFTGAKKIGDHSSSITPIAK